MLGWLCGPTRLGLQGGRLRPCPSSPNCVSSQADSADGQHHLPPIRRSGTLAATRQALLAVLEADPLATVVQAEGGYIHAEFRSRWLGFVDDVEFLIDTDSGLIHFRSASRIGYSDLGANRQRMKRLTTLLEDRPDRPGE